MCVASSIRQINVVSIVNSIEKYRSVCNPYENSAFANMIYYIFT